VALNWDTLVLAPLFGVFAENERVTFRPATGTPFLIDGVFDQAYRSISLVADVPATEEAPVLGVRLSQFPAPPVQSDQLFVPRVNTTYVVQEVRDDGQGHALLILNEVSSP
jgi:hypothetical protein